MHGDAPTTGCKREGDLAAQSLGCAGDEDNR